MNQLFFVLLMAISFQSYAQEIGRPFCGVYMRPSDSTKFDIYMTKVLVNKEVIPGPAVRIDLNMSQVKSVLQSRCPKNFPKEAHGECYIEELSKIDGSQGYGLYQSIPIRKDEYFGSRWFRAWNGTAEEAQSSLRQYQEIGICPKNTK